MKSETSEPEQIQIKSHKKSPSRPNFSQCGRLCDQTFYLENPHQNKSNQKVVVQVIKRSPPKSSTHAFTSVPRQKRGNFRFDIKLPYGQFTHHPDHMYGRDKSPSWSFPRKERYGNEKIEQYQICEKHPLARAQSKQKMYQSISSIKEELRNQVQLNKSSSLCETTDQSKNYSIVMPRKTSAVGFFSKTKIKNNFYLTRQEIMNGEEQLQKNRNTQVCPKGYIQFYKKKKRSANSNVKDFTPYLYAYSHEKQFNNFSMTHHPTKPSFHIDFDQHLDRPTKVRETKGPNFDKINLNCARKTYSNIDLNTSKFRTKIKTRYDRVAPEPNTRLDYDPPIPQLGGMITMDKMKPRTKKFFPIVDPIIKKAGDKQMKESLKKEIPVKQINEAMRPKCVNKIEV